MNDLPCSPAAERNKHAILETMQQILPSAGWLLEVASGTGQHAAWLASHMRGWQWQPTEFNSAALPTIAAWARQAAAANVRPPCLLNVVEAQWPSDDETLASTFAQPFDAMYCANMVHIAPWAACVGLLAGASRHLAPHGLLLIYGPFFEKTVASAPSNLEFHASLQQQNAEWGLRDLEAVQEEAARAGLELKERIAMPANNLMLVFERAPSLQKAQAA